MKKITAFSFCYRNIFPVIYAEKRIENFVYTDVFSRAAKTLGINVIYTLTDTSSLPKGWTGNVGRITDVMITKKVPDFKERKFYLSDPKAMVDSFEQTLHLIEIPKERIKKVFSDFA